LATGDAAAASAAKNDDDRGEGVDLALAVNCPVGARSDYQGHTGHNPSIGSTSGLLPRSKAETSSLGWGQYGAQVLAWRKTFW